MDYYKISFGISNQPEISDILTYELGEIGFESFDEDEKNFNAYIPADFFNEAKIQEICGRFIGKFEIPIKTELIPTQNWNATWESNYQPIEIGDLLRIRADFHSSKLGFENEIVIIPKMSFGTGHHETTQLVAKTMRCIDFKEKTVLDMGCGTGILAIYAEKLGATNIHAIDIEDFAYENSLDNTQLNNTKYIHVEKGGIEKIPSIRFNIILANINKNILLQQIPTYAKHLEKGGILILSGFFDSDCDELLKCGLSTGMEFVSKHLQNNWACLHLKKN
jgi:ribosomal protein L11 methyltransferase